MEEKEYNMAVVTKEKLKLIAPNGKDSILSDIEKYFDIHLNTYGVNTPLRVAHFISQCAHESDGFKTLQEYASGAGYEGRADLGNIHAGDGKRYKGRGMIQLTGRANYRTTGAAIGYDLENHPELALNPEVSVLTALHYWKSRKLNQFADADDILTITKRINGGTNGLESRKIYLTRAKKAFATINFDQASLVAKPQVTINNNDPFNIVMAKRGDNSNYVKDLQDMLIRKGSNIVADGDFGPATENAVKEFQKARNITVTGSIDTNTLAELMK